MIRIGLSLNNQIPPAIMHEAVRVAEELNYELCWVTEGIGREATTLLASMATITSNIRLGTGILPIYTRTATLLAFTSLSMYELTKGRFILGLGVSHEDEMWPEHGIKLEKPFQRTREYVHVIRNLLKDGHISFDGKVIKVPKVSFNFPMPAKQVPIYIAALGPQMAALAGEIADGVHFSMSTTEYLGEAINGMKEAARNAGRDPKQITVSGAVMTALGSEGEEKCRRHIAGFLRKPFFQYIIRSSGYSDAVDKIISAQKEGGLDKAGSVVPDKMLDALAMSGDSKTWKDKVEQRQKVGVDLVCPYFSAHGPNPGDLVVDGIRAMANVLK